MADCVVDKFCEANMARITNKSGFLMGIIRRMELEPPGSGPTLGDLPRGIRRKLEDLIEDRKISSKDIEARAIGELRDLGEEQGFEAVERFCATNLDSVRSKTGFLMGIIKRIREESRVSSRSGGSRGYDDRRDDRHDRRY
mmetsp:Transcript_6985/g.9449  ORF Transcript_6985/g.9449 Transcript_6985/m.9449 type:complete len:141 (-) Transcript_6985:187-609(-)